MLICHQQDPLAFIPGSRLYNTQILKISINNICLKFMHLKSWPYLSGNNELIILTLPVCGKYSKETLSRPLPADALVPCITRQLRLHRKCVLTMKVRHLLIFLVGEFQLYASFQSRNDINWKDVSVFCNKKINLSRVNIICMSFILFTLVEWSLSCHKHGTQ